MLAAVLANSLSPPFAPLTAVAAAHSPPFAPLTAVAAADSAVAAAHSTAMLSAIDLITVELQ